MTTTIQTNMALNYTKGTISHMSEVTSGTSKNGYDWARQTILLDIPGFQGSITKLSLQASNEMVNELNNFNVGDKVEVGWSIYAREWNGKWYNNVDLVNIKSQEQQEQRPAESARPATAARQARISRPAPQTKNIPASELEPQGEDLPF